MHPGHPVGIIPGRKTLMIVGLVFILPSILMAQGRVWNSEGPDGGAVHALGNGEMCVYGLGPGIIKLYPGPLSTPSIFTLDLVSEIPVETLSTREEGTAIWTHETSMTRFFDTQADDYTFRANVEL